ncbi:transposase [Streptosporangium sp. CA-135522]|uniref:transposase n=1 Tax=Streptosporangium sp. CA-135522 TaxID=3240072 RepID=UPI003D8E26ED
MRAAVEVRQWPTVFRLPAYAPELNPAEGVWSVLKRGLSNLAPCDPVGLAAMVKSKLKRMQYCHELLSAGGCQVICRARYPFLVQNAEVRIHRVAISGQCRDRFEGLFHGFSLCLGFPVFRVPRSDYAW